MLDRRDVRCDASRVALALSVSPTALHPHPGDSALTLHGSARRSKKGPHFGERDAYLAARLAKLRHDAVSTSKVLVGCVCARRD